MRRYILICLSAILLLSIVLPVSGKSLWEIIDCSYCGMVPGGMEHTGSIEIYIITIQHKLIREKKIILIYDRNKNQFVSVNWVGWK